MEKKVYKLKKMVKYTLPKDKALKASHDFRRYINKRNFQQTYGFKCSQAHKRYKRPSVLWLVAFYYGFVAVILLLKHLGI